MIIAQRTRLNALLNQESRLKQDIKDAKWQIDSLKDFSSPHQIRIWKKQKRHLTIRLNQVKKDIKQLESRIHASS
ncbi:MAG TPA: hypothetical protein VK589_11820 [Chryseolinea sp.]|nr:hypothetical protein [Chryseolinea sp.]